jgi:hypothetical protein
MGTPKPACPASEYQGLSAKSGHIPDLLILIQASIASSVNNAMMILDEL